MLLIHRGQNTATTALGEKNHTNIVDFGCLFRHYKNFNMHIPLEIMLLFPSHTDI